MLYLILAVIISAEANSLRRRGDGIFIPEFRFHSASSAFMPSSSSMLKSARNLSALYLSAFALLSLLLLSSCAGSGENRQDAGTSRSHQMGHPEVLARVSSFFSDENEPVADVTVELPHQHLIFRTRDGQRFAEVRLQISFRALQEGEDGDEAPGSLVKRSSERLFIEADDDPSGGQKEFVKRQALPPGRYAVDVSATDLSSGNTSRVTLQVQIPDPEGAVASNSDIKVLLSGEGGRRSVSSYLIPAARDSLMFEFFVTRQPGHEPVDLSMRLVRFRSDTDPARAMGDLPLNSGSIAFRGIDYSEREVIQQQERRLEDETGAVLINYGFSMPERGNYRFEIELTTADSLGQEVSTSTFRDFGIVSPGFPAISSTQEMAAPLKYLMRRRDYRRLMEIEDTDSLRLAVERFWLEDMNQEQARRQIQRYYTRVEEANRMFSSFKEGWKTDMGMVYIMMGPPLRVDQRIDAIVWYYGHNQFDPTSVMVFERPRATGRAWPFTHHVLVRNRFYQTLEIERIGDWTSGRISRP